MRKAIDAVPDGDIPLDREARTDLMRTKRASNAR